MYSGAEKNFGP